MIYQRTFAFVLMLIGSIVSTVSTGATSVYGLKHLPKLDESFAVGSTEPPHEDADLRNPRSIESAGDVETRVEVSDDSVRIAQPFTLTFKVYHSANLRIQFEPLPDSVGAFGVLRVRDQLDLPLRGTPSGETAKWQRESIRTVELEAWQAGELQFPGIKFTVVGLDSTSEPTPATTASEARAGVQLSSEPASVTVVSDRSPGESIDELRGLAGVQNATAQTPGTNWTWWAGGGLAAAVVATALFLLAKRPESHQPLSAWALERLSELRGSKYQSQQTGEERLASASAILRDYLNLRFGLEANVGTVAETVMRLREHGWSPIFVDRLERWLTAAEQVSFAGVGMDNDDVNRSITHAMDLVEEAEAMQPVLDQNDHVEFVANRQREDR